jgi:outer membrane protein OmpA-like peptidoglycan-associated protein
MKSIGVSWLMIFSLLLSTGRSQTFLGTEFGRYYVGAFSGGICLVGGNREDSSIRTWGGLRLGTNFSDLIGVEILTGTGFVGVRDETQRSKLLSYLLLRPGSPQYFTYLYPLLFELRLNKNWHPRWRTYLAVGSGLLFWDVRDVYAPGTQSVPLNIMIHGQSIYPNMQWDVVATVGAGAEWRLTECWGLQLGGHYQHILEQGSDMSGFGDVQTGNLEVRLGLCFYFSGRQDSDKDGIPDKHDGCPHQAEDIDGFQDNDGCPDFDNDQDGIPDAQDICPDLPEDIDGFQDADGCPDPDNDGDGIIDATDGCPYQAEDIDGFQDNDGCPDPDNDGDGIPDVKDYAPLQAEDFDGFQDYDGVPDFDNDGDGIPDIDDSCPNEPETKNGYRDSDGCPDQVPEVFIEKNEPLILEGVTFPTGSATLSLNARRILDKVYETLLKNPQLRIEIRGHTDNTGSRRRNIQVSQERADSVMHYLVARGIGENRLKAVGFGPDYPIAPNSTPQGRQRNRRIEFLQIE